MDTVELRIFNSPEEAPSFSKPEFVGLTLTGINIVHKGTVNGKATVDLILVDENGQKYVSLTKGSFLEVVGGMISTSRKG